MLMVQQKDIETVKAEDYSFFSGRYPKVPFADRDVIISINIRAILLCVR